MSKRKSMFYLISLTVALLLIGSGIVFVWLTNNTLAKHFGHEKQRLLASKAAGQLPEKWKDVDIENLDRSQISMRIPDSLHLRLDVADFLSSFWYVLMPMTVLLCLGIAFLLNR